MASRNHQFIELQETIFRRYHKTIMGSLAGMRVNPHKPAERLSFLLETPESNINWRKDEEYVIADSVQKIDYDTEVLEVYTVEEDKLFRRLNGRLFERGLLVEYQLEKPIATTENSLTDTEIFKLANHKTLSGFKTALKPITSQITFKRIKDALITLDRPMSFHRALAECSKDIE
jgi:hypothetical protein